MELTKNNYDRKTLKKYIYEFNIVDILKTQKLDATFVVRYLLNPKYQLADNEKMITSNMILQYQPHITKLELLDAILTYDSDDDSVEKFDTVANR
jgi:hypothetical protein